MNQITLIFLVALASFCLLNWQPTTASVVRREAPTTAQPNANQAIDDALNSFKGSLDDLVKKIQNNDVYQNVSATLKQFGEAVQQQSKQLADKITSTGAKTN